MIVLECFLYNNFKVLLKLNLINLVSGGGMERVISSSSSSYESINEVGSESNVAWPQQIIKDNKHMFILQKQQSQSFCSWPIH